MTIAWRRAINARRRTFDADLAQLYGVTTKRLNEQVKRNSERFPQDFIFTLNQKEKNEVVANCDHLSKLKFSKSLPYVFTEHGAIQAANVLASPQAIEMGVYVVRTFVRLREMVASNTELALRLNDLEKQTELLFMKQDTYQRETCAQLKQVFDSLRALMTIPPPPTKRPIGFVTPDDGPAGPKAGKERKQSDVPENTGKK